ncbi:Outer membrane fibronectin-binding protein [Labilithrix luteola]|uniref:Outer membrane fibronectin-binding protein n=1 Tax=Labilithrix luteola TaxID=1391654 RepID=A0A0K1PQZ0_9BACT|nr:OmpA family protein [Labilithrix luteola]AKU95942.1 Outer membrane fibronectin-binding protein [Labilithrix luteola]
MTGSLIETVEARLTPDVVGKVAGSIGESPAKVSGALSSAVPSIFAGLIQRGSTPGGAAGLLSSLKDVDSSRIGDVSDPRGMMGIGSKLSSGMLGDYGGRITDVISRTSGIGREGSSGIMSFVFPLIAGVIGKQVVSRGLGASGLMELLSSQKKAVLEHPSLPRGLNSALGIGDVSELGGVGAEIAEPHVSVAQVAPRQVAPPPRRVVPVAEKPRTPWGAIIGALVLGAILLGGLTYFSRRHHEVPAPHAQAPMVHQPNVQTPAAAPPPAPPAQPTGQATLTSGEMEKKDAAKKDTGMAAKKETGMASAFTGNAALPERVALPNVNFDTASCDLQSGGEATLQDVAVTMKDHPSSRVRIEGFTDSVGGDDINSPLSERRAETVKKTLVGKGVDANRIETVGMSEKHPVADNGTDDGRAQNRRADMVIISR